MREFYLQYAIYWTREALTWTHRDAQTGEAFKTLLLEGYGNRPDAAGYGAAHWHGRARG